ncbi:hypothetical protein D3C72_1565580 [compost metagenome]
MPVGARVGRRPVAREAVAGIAALRDHQRLQRQPGLGGIVGDFQVLADLAAGLGAGRLAQAIDPRHGRQCRAFDGHLALGRRIWRDPGAVLCIARQPAAQHQHRPRGAGTVLCRADHQRRNHQEAGTAVAAAAAGAVGAIIQQYGAGRVETPRHAHAAVRHNLRQRRRAQHHRRLRRQRLQPHGTRLFLMRAVELPVAKRAGHRDHHQRGGQRQRAEDAACRHRAIMPGSAAGAGPVR